MNKNVTTRFPLIDYIRGFAILLMIIFHIAYDLNLPTFQYVSIDFVNNTFWYLLPRVIVFLFFFSVGLSLTLIHFPTIKWKKFWIRFIKIASAALLISAITYLWSPSRWVYFGTLHSIAFCSLMALPFIFYPKLALAVGATLFFFSAIFDLNIPWLELEHRSMDYISPFPWIGAILLGIFAVHQKWHTLQPRYIPKLVATSLAFMGKYPLSIYLLHQPLILSVIYLFFYLKPHIL
ncbi:MAG: DUF1624 domain-containing protein [Bacteriovoracaceae bacterium]|nr:DUF1624 domain-containing protein [Bacteriovoracaceae bacterium]